MGDPISIAVGLCALCVSTYFFAYRPLTLRFLLERHAKIFRSIRNVNEFPRTFRRMFELWNNDLKPNTKLMVYGVFVSSLALHLQSWNEQEGSDTISEYNLLISVFTSLFFSRNLNYIEYEIWSRKAFQLLDSLPETQLMKVRFLSSSELSNILSVYMSEFARMQK